MNFSEVGTNSVGSLLVVSLGQTPDYLDPQSQEAVYEVDVSGMALRFSVDQHQRGKPQGLEMEELVRIGR